MKPLKQVRAIPIERLAMLGKANDVTIVEGSVMTDDGRTALARLESEDWIGLDLETGGLHPKRDPLAVVALAAADGFCAVFHCPDGMPDELRTWLGTPGHRYIGHNVTNFDAPYLAANGVEVYAADWYDTLNGELVTLRQHRRDMKVSLAATVQRRLGKALDKDIDHGSWMHRTALTERQLEYVTGDIRHLHALRESQVERCSEAEGRQLVALDLERQIAPVIVHMRDNGLPVDRELLREYLIDQLVKADELEDNITAMLDVVNLGSPVQLAAGLRKLGVQVGSTAHGALTDLALRLRADENDELASLVETIIEWRHCRQRLKVYTPAWLAEHVVNGRIHAQYWPCGTDTNRFSSSNPNLQQIPKDMRYVFGGLAGQSMVWADYGQIEIRVAAAISRDDDLLAALASEDIHRQIAAQVFGRPGDRITSAERKIAKYLTFCLLFGGTYKTLHRYARQNGGSMTQHEARDLSIRFFDTYRGIAQWHRWAERQVAGAYNRSISLSLPSGFRRTLSGLDCKAPSLLNTMVQGTAACGLKLAMVAMRERGLDRPLCATVHDEFVSCVPTADAASYGEQLATAMRLGMGRLDALREVPIVVEVKSGSHWG